MCVAMRNEHGGYGRQMLAPHTNTLTDNLINNGTVWVKRDSKIRL
jgi:hypothetical protein